MNDNAGVTAAALIDIVREDCARMVEHTAKTHNLTKDERTGVHYAATCIRQGQTALTPGPYTDDALIEITREACAKICETLAEGYTPIPEAALRRAADCIREGREPEPKPVDAHTALGSVQWIREHVAGAPMGQTPLGFGSHLYRIERALNNLPPLAKQNAPAPYEEMRWTARERIDEGMSVRVGPDGAYRAEPSVEKAVGGEWVVDELRRRFPHTREVVRQIMAGTARDVTPQMTSDAFAEMWPGMKHPLHEPEKPQGDAEPTGSSVPMPVGTNGKNYQQGDQWRWSQGWVRNGYLAEEVEKLRREYAGIEHLRQALERFAAGTPVSDADEQLRRDTLL